jgi:hypothetical protein
MSCHTLWSAEVFASAHASAPTPAPPEEGTDALQAVVWSDYYYNIFYKKKKGDSSHFRRCNRQIFKKGDIING